MDIKELKKKSIADAARDLFSKYGYKMVNMDKIAEKSNVAKGTLYLYFKDKEELFNYLINEVIEEIKEFVIEIKSRELSLSEEITEVVYNLLLYRKNQKFLYRVFNEAQELKTYIAINGVKMIDELINDYLEDRFSTVVDAIKINKKVLSFAIIKVYTALAFEWEESHEPLDEREIARTIGFLIKGSVCNSSIN